MSHRVGVMYLGKIVEEGSPEEFFTNPLHPYTKALILASLPADPRCQREEMVLTGEVPSPLNPPSGCAFHIRVPSSWTAVRWKFPNTGKQRPDTRLPVICTSLDAG